jgi:hypothetical protein
MRLKRFTKSLRNGILNKVEYAKYACLSLKSDTKNPFSLAMPFMDHSTTSAIDQNLISEFPSKGSKKEIIKKSFSMVG